MYSVVLMAALAGGSSAPAGACYGFWCYPCYYPCYYPYYSCYYPYFTYPVSSPSSVDVVDTRDSDGRSKKKPPEPASKEEVDRKLDAMKGQIDRLQEQMKEQIGQLQNQMKETLGQLREKMSEQIGQLQGTIKDQVGRLQETMNLRMKMLDDRLNALERKLLEQKLLEKIDRLEDRLKRLEEERKKKEAEQLEKPPRIEDEKPPRIEDVSRAMLIVKLPVDARLYLDGRLTRTKNRTSRTFITPKLEEGEDYYFTIRAETIRAGEVVTETKRVVFRAGSKVRVSFPTLDRRLTVAAVESR